MGQKVSPIGFRTGVTIGWKSRWFAPKSNYGEFLVEDARIREVIDRRLNRQPKIFLPPIADPAGTAARRTITVTGGPAAEAADIVLSINGNVIRAGVSVGDSDTVVAAAIASRTEPFT